MTNGTGEGTFLSCRKHLNALVELALARSTATSIAVKPMQETRKKPEDLAAQEAIARRKRAEQVAMRALVAEQRERFELLVRIAFTSEA
ncbi:hypothetical protein ADK54_08700 [Streptomyces sp. WM6378]|nr:hypothetical protein ADK54_08700 [Streptomyces sp. WM6378]